MKRFFIFVFLIFSIITINVLAVDLDEYYIKEYDLSISFPKGYYVLTKESQQLKKTLSALENYSDESVNSVLSMFDEYGISATASSPDFKKEFSVIISKNDSIDLKRIDEQTIKDAKKIYMDEVAAEGGSLIDFGKYSAQTCDFVVMNIDYNNGAYALKYLSYFGGLLFRIDMTKYNSAITDDDSLLIKKVVDSVVFDYSKKMSNEVNQKTTSLYTDDDGGVEVSIPSNWSIQDTVFDNTFVDVKFKHENTQTIIQYGSANLIESTPTGSNVNSDTWKYSNSLSIETFKEQLKIESKCEKKKYGNNDYYIVYVRAGDKMSGISYPFDMVMACHYINEWQYLFAFDGRETDALYPDFEKMLESAVFKKKTDNEDYVELNQQNTNDKSEDYQSIYNNVLWIIIILFIVIIVILIVIIVLLKNKRT